MQVKAGTRLKSTVSSTEVIVVRPPAREIALTCGGVAMADVGEAFERGTVRSGFEGQALLGKRYYDEEAGLELLCTKGGQGQLACDGRALLIKEAKPLPSSD
jgi:hypothetical protein